jgi:hypothetical protein
VLGLALLRLAGAAQVDRSTLVAVPTFESVAVVRRDERPPPREIARRVAAGELARWDAAVLYAGWYEAVPPDELAASIYPTWADGTAGPYVARAFASRGEQAVAAAARALASSKGRVARMTAVRVLAAVGGERAEALLDQAQRGDDPALRAMAQDALEGLQVARGALSRDAAAARRQREAEAVARLAPVVLSAARHELRLAAVDELASFGSRFAIPVLRAAFSADSAAAVRSAAAIALAQLGDTEIVDRLVALLAQRHAPGGEAPARLAARALGILGDVRGLDELLAAYAETWKPAVIGEALRSFGPAALGPMLDLFESRPELARRKPALDAIRAMPPDELAGTMSERLAQKPENAVLYRRLSGASRS